jgi:hypothetical protein
MFPLTPMQNSTVEALVQVFVNPHTKAPTIRQRWQSAVVEAAVKKRVSGNFNKVFLFFFGASKGPQFR